MRTARFLPLALLSASTVMAQTGDRHPVAESNNWSISEADCGIDASWEDGAAVTITAHEDHHDLGVFDAHFKGVAKAKVIPVRFGAGGTLVTGRDYEALGYRDQDNTGYVANVDDALLDRIAAANSIQFYRGKAMLADLDVTGLVEALGAMRVCEAATGRHTQVTADALEDRADALDRAADAAEGASGDRAAPMPQR
jgi:hypothetical protein